MIQALACGRPSPVMCVKDVEQSCSVRQVVFGLPALPYDVTAGECKVNIGYTITLRVSGGACAMLNRDPDSQERCIRSQGGRLEHPMGRRLVPLRLGQHVVRALIQIVHIVVDPGKGTIELSNTVGTTL